MLGTITALPTNDDAPTEETQYVVIRRSRRIAGLPPEMDSETDNEHLAPASGLPTPAASGHPWQPYIEPRTFAGKAGEDVDAWLSFYQRASRFNGWNATGQLTNVGLFLKGTASVWYENHEESLTTWPKFVDEIRKCFGDPAAKKKRAEQTLMQRAQVPGETCTTYIEEVLKLCKVLDPRMTEEDKVGHLLKGIAEDVYQYLIAKENLESVSNVILHCRTFEALRARRITPKFGRLANVTTVASVDVAPAPSDLASIIRQVVREELDRREAASVPSPRAREPLPSCDPSVTSINAASVDAYNFAPRPMVPSPAVNAHLGYEGHDGFVRGPSAVSQTWDGRAMYPPAGNFSMSRERPICFQCGVRGHVARFCPQRRRMSAPSTERPRTFYRRNNHPGDRANWPPGPDSRTPYRLNYRSDSPASVRSLTPPPGRQHRSPSPLRRLTSPPPGN